MHAVRKALILVHRYLGIPLAGLFVLWFASGIVMMYAGGMPTVTQQARLERLPAIDLDRVRLTPGEAAARARLPPRAGQASLFMVMNRPAYRFDGVTVFADRGDVLTQIDATAAHDVARLFTGVATRGVRHVDTLRAVDQWTMRHGAHLPLYRFEVDDGAGSIVDVSSRTGEVVMWTTQRGRLLAWLGVIPHWLYFAPLRLNQPLWYDIVVWTSTLGCALAVVGLILGVLQFRWGRTRERSIRAALAARLPYSGWMRWHYVTGVVFGVFTLSWVFSGLLSMEPYAWTSARGLQFPPDVLTGGPVDLEAFRAIGPGEWRRITDGRELKQVDLIRIQGAPYYVVHAASVGHAPVEAERRHQPYYLLGLAEPDRLLVDAGTLSLRAHPFGVESIVDRLSAAVPDTPVVESALLTDYDSYYYSQARQLPLPVLRVKFADAADTWVYVDPEMSRVLATVHRLSRVERWLFNGLHSLDFAFWYDRRPLWDIGMIALSLGGLASSGIGFWLGLGRIRRALALGRTRRVARSRPSGRSAGASSAGGPS